MKPSTREFKSLDQFFKEAGFNVGISRLVYTRDIGKQTMLIVEGRRVKGASDLRFTFYKASYEPRFHGKMSRVKVYCVDKPARQVLQRVYRHLQYMKLLEV
ncbi:hypothetical protein [Listeria costaricensis]|uniref:hypothetical protein n=1 Tax=Listeria costaricensis TaxID=2026604 RepID=UPI000C0861BB|nr:hypothetical protein [Listeria costaricensis]